MPDEMPRDESVQKFTVDNYGCYRHFAVYESKDAGERELICITVYKKGATEVARRLNTLTTALAAISAPAKQ